MIVGHTLSAPGADVLLGVHFLFVVAADVEKMNTLFARHNFVAVNQPQVAQAAVYDCAAGVALGFDTFRVD